MNNLDEQIQKLVEKGRGLVNNGRGQEAVEFYKNAIVEVQKMGERKWEGYFFQQLGVALGIVSSYEEAIDAIWKAQKIFGEVKDYLGEGSALRDLGIIKIKQEKYDEAIDWLNTSSDILSENTNDWNAIAVTGGKLAYAYLKKGDLAKARGEFVNALKTAMKGGDWFMQMTILLNFAELDFSEQKYGEGIIKLLASLGLIYEKGDAEIQKRRLVEIYALLSKGYKQTGAIDASERYLKKAKELLEKMPKELQENLSKLFE